MGISNEKRNLIFVTRSELKGFIATNNFIFQWEYELVARASPEI